METRPAGSSAFNLQWSICPAGLFVGLFVDLRDFFLRLALRDRERTVRTYEKGSSRLARALILLGILVAGTRFSLCRPPPSEE